MALDLRHRYRRPDRLRQLWAFCRTADLGSVPRAAEALSLAPAAVALHVRELEHELDATLLDLDPRGITAATTPAGERLHELVHPLLEAFGELGDRIEDTGSEPAGSDLHVSAEEGMAVEVVSRTIRRLRGERPELAPRVRAGSFREGLRCLLAEETSLVFGVRRSVPDEVVFLPLLSPRWVAVAPAGHPLAAREAVTLEEVGQAGTIAPSPESLQPELDEGQSPYRHPAFQRNFVVEVSHWRAALAFVEDGLGVTVAESLAVPEPSRVSLVPLAERLSTRTVGLFHRREGPEPRFLRAFVAALRAEYPDASSEHRAAMDGGRRGRGVDEREGRGGQEGRGRRDGQGGKDGQGGQGERNGQSAERSTPHPQPYPYPHTASASRTDPLRRLRAFCLAVKDRSVSRAAERVFSNQPTVSKWIRDVEAGYGTRLFHRSTGGIVPTRAGQRLYRHAMPLVHALDRLPETFDERFHGKIVEGLRIGAGQTSAAALLPPYIGRFQKSCPGVEVKLRLGGGAQRLEWLRNFEVDLVIGSTSVEDPEFERLHLVDSSFVLITPEDHPLAGRKSVSLSEVAEYPTIGHHAESYTGGVGHMVFRQLGLAVDRAVEVGGWDAIKRYVEAGAGIAIIPDICVSSTDRVCEVAIPGAFPSREYSMARRKDATPSLAVERFLGVVGSGDAHEGRGDEG